MNDFAHSPQKLHLDQPITKPSDDKLGRAQSAQNLADYIMQLDASNGIVVGISGPWGSGKTSFVNLMRARFKETACPFIDFNPWMFSNSDPLVSLFLTQLAGELKLKDRKRFKKVIKQLGMYASFLKPASKLAPSIGLAIFGEIAAPAIGTVTQNISIKNSVSELRQDITNELKRLDQPLIVFLDDIDRLSTSEIREIFKLVRLTASFPNVIYLLAFDRERVEDALSENGIPGRAFLEKILQINYDLPTSPRKALQDQLLDELNSHLELFERIKIDEDRWIDVFFEIIAPLITNVRDIRRYIVSLQPSLTNFGLQLNLVDLLAMEAVRVFRPTLFSDLTQNRDTLTAQHRLTEKEAKEQLDALTEKHPKDKSVLQGIFNRIFPYAASIVTKSFPYELSPKEWKMAHRLANNHFLNFYLDSVSPAELATFKYAEEAFSLMEDYESFSEYLSALPVTQLEDVVKDLRSFESRYTANMAISASIALLNLVPVMNEQPRTGTFLPGHPIITVRYIVDALIRQIASEEQRETIVSEIIKKIETYSSQLSLILTVGYQPSRDDRLISETFAEELMDRFVERVIKAEPAKPEDEWDLWRVYDRVRERSNTDVVGSLRSPALQIAIIRSVRGTSHSWSLGSRTVSSTNGLAWKELIGFFGSEQAIRDVVCNVRSTLGDDEVLQLADEYLSGKREPAE